MPPLHDLVSSLSSVRRRGIVPAMLLLAIGAASCGDSTGPSHPVLRIGQTTDGELSSAAAVDSFSFSLARATPVVIILEPLGNLLTLRVNDSQGRSVSAVTGDGTGASPELATRLIETPVGDQYLVRVSVPTGGTPGAYRIHVMQSLIEPERIGDIIALGDTITGEALEHTGDVDDFWVEAPGGTEIEAYIRTPGAAPGHARIQVFLTGEVPTANSAGWDDDFEAGTVAAFTAVSGGRTYFRVSTTDLGRGRQEFPLRYEMVFRVAGSTP